MNLGDLRAEVLARGFDPVTYGARVNNFLNDGQNLISRRVQDYLNESFEDFATVSGTASYPIPADFARLRELYNTDENRELPQVGLTQVDRSQATVSQPSFFAMNGTNLQLYPVPDGIYNLRLRYWRMPTQMVADTDVPDSLPSDWHRLLWLFATWQCYESDDDAAMGQYWQGRFNTELSEFTAQARFPSSDFPLVASSMWSDGDPLIPNGNSWSLWGWEW